MQDISYLQAMQNLQDRLSNHFLDTIAHMLVHRTTATKATLHIQDEKVRAIVKNALITDQLITLITLMKEMSLLDEAQSDEFTAYLIHSLTHQPY